MTSKKHVKISDRRWRCDLTTEEGQRVFFKRMSIEAQYKAKLFRVHDAIRINRRHAHATAGVAKLRLIANHMREAIKRKLWANADREYDQFTITILEMRLAFALPLARHGQKFPGRKPGSGSAIRKAIVKELKRERDLQPLTLWAILADDPPRGWKFCDNREGRYIEGPKASDGMLYRRFQNLVAEVRRLGR